jgi:hypothetical protein
MGIGMKTKGEGGTLFAVKSPQDLFSALAVLAVSGVVLWGLSRITTTRFAAISPTLFPKICAYALVIGGIMLLVRAFMYEGPKVEPFELRGTALVTLAVILFGFLTPVVGYIVAGFVTVVLGGLGSKEARIKELVLVGAGLCALCFILFTLLLGLSIPAMIIPGLVG